ncbi:MAG: helix-turn-helix domain-containing protein [Polyangiaceae bacterium]
MGFGDTVRRRRIEAELTLEKLAERAGLSPNFLGAVELEKREPSLSTVIAIARGLRVGVGELLGGVEGLTAEGIEAARLFEAVPAEDQVALRRLMRSLARRRR